MESAYNLKKDLAAFTAEKEGVTADYVRKVMRIDRGTTSKKAQAIIDTYMNELERRQATLRHVTVSYQFN